MQLGHHSDEFDPEELERLQRIERGRQRPRDPHHRIPRTSHPDHPNSRAGWFRTGRLIPGDDPEISPWNLGLGERERQAMGDENTRPWGQDIFAQAMIRDRAAEAARRGRNQKRRGWTSTNRKKVAPLGWLGRLIERRRGTMGRMERPTRANRGWHAKDR